jgi:hypothetical protein
MDDPRLQQQFELPGQNYIENRCRRWLRTSAIPRELEHHEHGWALSTLNAYISIEEWRTTTINRCNDLSAYSVALG